MKKNSYFDLFFYFKIKIESGDFVGFWVRVESGVGG